MCWNATAIVESENVAVGQLGGSRPGSLPLEQTQASSVWTTGPASTSTLREIKPPVGDDYFRAAIIHPDGWCNHYDSKGVRCKKQEKQGVQGALNTVTKMARHWLNAHALKELLHGEILDHPKCTILKSAEMVDIAKEYRLPCPIQECRAGFADISSLERHIMSKIKPHEKTRSKLEAKILIRDIVKPRRKAVSNGFDSGTCEAVWRLLQARGRIGEDLS
ncbi:hypothetical protein K439DRAFT_1640066 [Ramaria rubella]|nr:hypothetical protein K439DRAFT_1640066 [Ramaria rubella]